MKIRFEIQKSILFYSFFNWY